MADRVFFGTLLQPNRTKQKTLQATCRVCDPAGIRTQGPYIKSVLLYQLSYRILQKPLFVFDAAKVRAS